MTFEITSVLKFDFPFLSDCALFSGLQYDRLECGFKRCRNRTGGVPEVNTIQLVGRILQAGLREFDSAAAGPDVVDIEKFFNRTVSRSDPGN